MNDDRMTFDARQLRDLYGKTWFALPDDPWAEGLRSGRNVEEAAPAAPEPHKGPMEWRPRPGSRYCLIMEREEFADTKRTQRLKEWLVEAGVNPKDCSFGLLPEGRWPEGGLADLQDERAVVLSDRLEARAIAEGLRSRVALAASVAAAQDDENALVRVRRALEDLAGPLLA